MCSKSEETRHEQYLRILTDGPDGEKDYEAVRYLVDKGYSDSKYIVSRMKDSYGSVRNVAWLGPNANGVDYIDQLRAITTQSKTKEIEQQDKKHNTNDVLNYPKKTKPKISWVGIAETVIAAIVIAAIFFILAKHFDIHLNQ